MANIYGEKPNIKVQWEKVKDAPFKDKVEWYFQYFGLYTLIAVAVIAAVIIFTVTIIRNKQPELISMFCWDVMFENDEDKALKEALSEKLEKDPKKEKLTLNGSFTGADGTEYYVYQQEALLVRVAGKTIDIVAGRESGLNGFVDPEDPENSIFTALDGVLSAEVFDELEKSGRLRYITLDEGGETPYFINIAGSRLAGILNIKNETYCIGVTCTAPHMESVEALLQLVLEAD